MGKVNPVQFAFIVDRYLEYNNFTHTLPVFRTEVSTLLSKTESQKTLKGLGVILDEYISVKDQEMIVDRYLSENNFSKTLSMFRTEASTLLSKTEAQEEAKGLGAILDDYICLKQQNVILEEKLRVDDSSGSVSPPSMSINPNIQSTPEEGKAGLSKKAAKKESMRLEKKLKREQEAAAAAVAAELAVAASIESDPLKGNYGDVQYKAISGRKWTEICLLNEDSNGEHVLIRGRVQTTRPVGKNIGFLVLREKGFTIQCVITVADNLVSRQMVKFATSLSRESVVDVEGIVTVPQEPIVGASQEVEVQVRKIHCISKAMANLPISIEDASRSDADIKANQLPGVNQDKRLNFRVLDLRTSANQAIFRVQSEIGNGFRDFMLSEGFVEIHTPKSLEGSSEGGADVFRFDYNSRPASLAQSPQLHKQMAICADFGRVFEVCPVFRAEKSFTNRHLCEFTALVMEMEIKEHYFEVMDIVDRLFVAMFDRLNDNCQRELEAIRKQYPFEPLKYRRKTLRLTFQEGIQMLKEAGMEVDPLGDLNTESERKLGQLVLEKYGTEFYILHRYPLAARPFFTMPCDDDPAYSKSFDVFIRGEEIISGAQRIHELELLITRAEACGIDPTTISSYIESFRYGVTTHGGFGVGLERVAMLFCALNNIRKASLFPRDPTRLSP